MILSVITVATNVWVGVPTSTVSLPCDELLARARVLYTHETVADPKVDFVTDPEYRKLLSDIKGCKDLSGRKDLDEFLVSRIEMIGISDDAEDAVDEQWLDNRRAWISSLPLFTKYYSGREDLFDRYCRYVGNVGYIPEPRRNDSKDSRGRTIRRNMAVSPYRGTLVDVCEATLIRDADKMDEQQFSTLVRKTFDSIKCTPGEAAYRLKRVESAEQRIRSVKTERQKSIKTIGEWPFDRTVEAVRANKFGE